ncbi:MAG: sulfatase-like hydrolase/transferase, partial [Phycisphaerae bacterium]
DLTLDFMQRRIADGEPFFCALSAQPPHDPYVAPEAWMGRHNPATVRLRPNVPDVGWVRDRARRDLAGYHAMIENLDWNVGRVWELIRTSALRENTHIVFFSDHGDMHGSHGLFRKTNPYEESIRVPFIVSGLPSQYYGRNGTCDAPVNHVDVGATSLGLCGIEVPDWVQGTDYSARRLHGRTVAEEPDSAYLQLVIPTKHGDSTDRPWRGIVTRDGWKYVCLEHQPWLMFDLNTDPYEQVNLAHNSAFSQKRQQLHARLAKWVESTQDTFPLPEV